MSHATQTKQATQTVQSTAHPNKKMSLLLMAGHLCCDINQGALVATLPFLVLLGGFSYTEATALLFASNIASAIIQPLFGWLGDTFQKPWIMALGITLAGLGMAGVGIFSTYWLILVSAMVSGIGIAMFHPEGGRLANLVAGEKKSSGMSIFAVGGKLGFSAGPLMAAAALSSWGLIGTVIFIVPSLICSLVLLVKNSTFLSYGSKKSAVFEGEIEDNWKAFSIVMCALSARSIFFYALTAFIPLFLVSVLGQSESFSSSMIALYAIVGALGTIASGWASQRIGTKKLIIIAYTLVAILVALFAFNQSLIFAVILIMLLAIAVDLSYPSAVALGQGFVPNHLGMASGLSFGVVVCIGGIASPILGSVGDVIGLQPVMLILVGVAVVGILAALAIPNPLKKLSEKRNKKPTTKPF